MAGPSPVLSEKDRYIWAHFVFKQVAMATPGQGTCYSGKQAFMSWSRKGQHMSRSHRVEEMSHTVQAEHFVSASHEMWP